MINILVAVLGLFFYFVIECYLYIESVLIIPDVFCLICFGMCSIWFSYWVHHGAKHYVDLHSFDALDIMFRCTVLAFYKFGFTYLIPTWKNI